MVVKRHIMRRSLFSWMLVLPLLLLSTSARAESFDYSTLDKLLKGFVNPQGYVDYDALAKTGEPTLNEYLQQIANAKISKWTYEEQVSFWINAYNAVMIREVLNNPLMHRVDQRFELFDAPHPIAEGQYSLNDIQHRILRGQTNSKTHEGPIEGVTVDHFDPRIHFALCNGALSSPKLQNTAYTAENLIKLLNLNAIRFANHPKHVRVEKGRLHVSILMKWYRKDFEAYGGSAKFLAKLQDTQRRKDATKIKRLLLRSYSHAIFDYDWTTNDVSNASKDIN